MWKMAAWGGAALIAAPFALILSQWPLADPRAGPGAGLDFTRAAARPDALPPAPWRAPDGATLWLRHYRPAGADLPLVVMLHGSGWHGLQFDALARRVAAAGLAEVLVPDLRGHGPMSERRGDLDYIGQLEDDLAALIRAHARPGQRVILLGHSSGGGLALRMAGGRHGGLIDGAVLLAPYLGHDAPTARPGSGGWARPLVRRIIGLSLLDRLGLTALHGLTVVQFRFPGSVLDGPLGDSATRGYSYRMNVSYAPRPGLADVPALPPFLLVAGAADEAFRAEAYRPALEALTGRGRYLPVPGMGHPGIVDAEPTYRALAGWLQDMARRASGAGCPPARAGQERREERRC
ncbi:MAG: alpha/beta hydrolase [Paracoccaceae bacterium]|nr:MAG: alpha/beta hydrolase [Paracoccaceae bacterium]